MKHEFRHWYTNAVLHVVEIPDGCLNDPLRAALEQAASNGADLFGARLSGANLSGAYLSGANLSGAYLSGAYLSDANLSDANLSGANLSGADLSGADLFGARRRGANLSGANLSDANLSGAYLSNANLSGADLSGAYLSGANLSGANLSDANLSGAYLFDARNLPTWISAVDPPEPYKMPPEIIVAQAERARLYRNAHPEVPVVEQLDAKILDMVTTGGGTLYMNEWHRDGECGTTHCRAGWAVHLAGKAGYDLEHRLGSAEQAGAQIYMASVGFVPWFYATDHIAMADIRRCAAEQIAIAVP